MDEVKCQTGVTSGQFGTVDHLLSYSAGTLAVRSQAINLVSSGEMCSDDSGVVSALIEWARKSRVPSNHPSSIVLSKYKVLLCLECIPGSTGCERGCDSTLRVLVIL